jgi:GNAT superfamily N-acetyltransferase
MSVGTRPGSADDFPAILALARRALGWTDSDARFLAWKHLENPFGASPMWVAVDGERIVGFRTFLRWELVQPSGAVVRAVRAVDTATDPDYQGQGIFTRLTLDALGALADEGVDLVFNTPNERSLPGYLKMGWREVGRLPVAVMPTSFRFPVVVASARQSAGREGVPTTAGGAIEEAFSDDRGVERLLGSVAGPSGLATRRTVTLFRWRYGLSELGYRALAATAGSVEDGVAVFRLRRRGRAMEGVLCELLVPESDRSAARSLIRRLARLLPTDYLIRLDSRVVTSEPFIRLPPVGPVLVCRPLVDSVRTRTSLHDWALTLGDVELF